MEDLPEKNIDQVAQFLTTEHFTLQGAKNATISEANGRLGHYISIVGSSVVALAFVANISGLGRVFFAFSLVLLPLLIVLGIGTLIRTIQIGIDYARLAQATNRIRHFYLDHASEAQPYFSLPHYDDPQAVQQTMMPFHSPLQSLASTPGPIILINSVLTGIFAGIMTESLFSPRLILSMAISIGAVAVTLFLHMHLSDQVWKKAMEKSMETRFPAPEV